MNDDVLARAYDRIGSRMELLRTQRELIVKLAHIAFNEGIEHACDSLNGKTPIPFEHSAARQHLLELLAPAEEARLGQKLT